MKKKPRTVATLKYLRFLHVDGTTHGTFSLNGKKLCHGIENTQYNIEPNTYLINEYMSPRNGKCILLMNVPEHSYIEVHPANWAKQLKGCIAPCDLIVNNMGHNSKNALTILFHALSNYDKWYLRIDEDIKENTYKSVV